MRLTFALTTIIALSFAQAPLWAGECTYAGAVEALQGKVEIRHKDNLDWQPVSLSTELCQFDQLKTGPLSRATVRLVNETLVQVDAQTTLSLTEVEVEREKSILELIQGLVHTMSRVPRSLEVHTPFVNAAIEGTEFVVHAQPTGGKVAVLEGTVRVDNAQGSVLLQANESASASSAESSPVKQLSINPLEHVSWKVKYLPLLEIDKSQLDATEDKAWREFRESRPDLAVSTLDAEKNNTDSARLIRAASLLSLGQLDRAESELATPISVSAANLSLQAIIAIARNEPNLAAQHIASAKTLQSHSAEAWLAESYLAQSKTQLDAALTAAKQAHNLAPNNSLAAARLSEVYLMTGASAEALATALKATQVSPEHDTVKTALGFALLNTGDTAGAQKVFEEAIALNSYNSDNHLGLGLSKIRKGNTADGRSHLETATLLNPKSSLLRSYLGKAYFQEHRAGLSYDQYALAKQYDPADPTPWLYDAIALERDNRGVEALDRLKTSIALNDNRSVYRSDSLLYDDQASRVAAQGAIYQSLGFTQMATAPAVRGLALAPGNSGAHRLLADSYFGQHHFNLARINELKTSRFLAEISEPTIPAHLLRQHSAQLERSGPLLGGYNEHNRLFSESGSYAYLGLSAASFNTFAGDLTAGLISDTFNVSASTYRLDTDGDKNAVSHYDSRLTNFDIKWQATPRLRLFASHDIEKTDKGKPSQRYFAATDLADFQRWTDSTRNTAGLIYTTKADLQFLARASATDSAFRTIDSSLPNTALYSEGDNTVDHTEFQLTSSANQRAWLVGGGKRKVAIEGGFDPVVTPSGLDTRQESEEETAYGYHFSEHLENAISLTLGLEHRTLDAKQQSSARMKELLPKIGLSWQPTPRLSLSSAYFETMISELNYTETESLQPSQIAGFNQIHRGQAGQIGKTKGLGAEWHPHKRLNIGIRFQKRNNSSLQQTVTLSEQDLLEPSTLAFYNSVKNTDAWLYWSISNRLSLSLEHHYESIDDNFESATGTSTDGLEWLKTHSTPITLNYRPNQSFSASLVNTYTTQKGTFWRFPEIPSGSYTQERGNEAFWLTDLALNYRLPKQRGNITIGVKNLFDESFRFEDHSSFDLLVPNVSWTPSSYNQSRFWFTSLSFQF